MPITKSAKKAVRVSQRKRLWNDRRKRAMKQATKNVRDLLGANKTDEAKNALPATYKAIDKATKRGVIKKNTAARRKSRLAKHVNKTAA